MHFAVFFILLKEEMVVVYLLQVFTSWAVNILTDPTSTNRFGLLSLTALKNYVNRIKDEKHLLGCEASHWKGSAL